MRIWLSGVVYQSQAAAPRLTIQGRGHGGTKMVKLAVPTCHECGAEPHPTSPHKLKNAVMIVFTCGKGIFVYPDKPASILTDCPKGK